MTSCHMALKWALVNIIVKLQVTHRGTQWCSWLRHWATSQKVTGSIPDSVIGIFHWHNPSGCIMALGLTQPLSEMSTRNISFGGGCKGGQCVGLTILPPSCGDSLEIWSLKLLEPSGPVQACNGIALPLLIAFTRLHITYAHFACITKTMIPSTTILCTCLVTLYVCAVIMSWKPSTYLLMQTPLQMRFVNLLVNFGLRRV